MFSGEQHVFEGYKLILQLFITQVMPCHFEITEQMAVQRHSYIIIAGIHIEL